jgi:methylmalonyl-CoA mutase cobalamin-binding domain/chain
VETAKRLTQKAIEEGTDPLLIVQQLTEVMRSVGDRFSRLELFLSNLMASGLAMQECVTLLKPHIAGGKLSVQTKGKVVIGTVTGDIHDIGKTIVGTMLIASGFDVVDLGIDQPSIAFIEKAREGDAQIIALSALMSTTAPYQKDVINLLNELSLRGKYKVLVGGGAVTAKWAEEIGADGYAPDAVQAVKIAENLTITKR